MELLKKYLSALAVVCLVLVVLLPGSSCRNRLSLPGGPGNSPGWPTASGEPAPGGLSSTQLVFPLQLRWKTRTRGSVVASPMVIGDLICVGTLGKRFYFLSAADGQRYGAIKTDAGISATAAAGEGSVYLATEADEGLVYAFDLRRGEIRWKTAVGDVSAPLIYHRGRLLVSTNLGRVICLGSEDGSSLWQFSTRGMRVTAAAVSGGTAVCGCDDGYLYALGLEDGQERWSRQLEGAVWSRPSIGGNRIYVGTFEGTLYCLEFDDGEMIWRRELEGGITRPPALGDEVLFVGTDRGLLVAVDRHSGQSRWAHRMADARPGAPLATPEALLVGGSDGQITALSVETGEPLWSHQVAGGVVAAPVIWQGRLYVGSTDDVLYAFTSAHSETTAAAPAGRKPAGEAGSLSP